MQGEIRYKGEAKLAALQPKKRVNADVITDAIKSKGLLPGYDSTEAHALRSVRAAGH